MTGPAAILTWQAHHLQHRDDPRSHGVGVTVDPDRPTYVLDDAQDGLLWCQRCRRYVEPADSGGMVSR